MVWGTRPKRRVREMVKPDEVIVMIDPTKIVYSKSRAPTGETRINGSLSLVAGEEFPEEIMRYGVLSDAELRARMRKHLYAAVYGEVENALDLIRVRLIEFPSNWSPRQDEARTHLLDMLEEVRKSLRPPPARDDEAGFVELGAMPGSWREKGWRS